MRSTFKIVVIGLSWVSFGALASAQTLFQNTNQRCETEEVLCQSDENCGDDAESLACRFINLDGTFSNVDFNGDGFADCVALAPEASSSPSPNLSVLINQAAGATACEPGPGDQFAPSVNYNVLLLDEQSSNVVAGNLNAGNSDIGIPSTETDDVLELLNPGTGFGAPGDLNPTGVGYDDSARNQSAVQSSIGERSTALFDCDGDNVLDAVVAVEDQSPEASPFASVRLNILRNNGSGLQPLAGAADSVPTNVFWSPSNSEFLDRAALTLGDFDNDDDLDIAVAINVQDFTTFPNVLITEAVNVCFNNGACGFTCDDPPTINIFDTHPTDELNPTSVEAGDFNGDDNIDLVVALPDIDNATPFPQGLQYYFGDGTGNFPNTQFNAYPFAGVLGLELGVLTTGCYNNDNVRDVAVTSFDAESLLNSVGVFTSDGSGGLNSSVPLFVLGTFVEGIDTADFDQAGGDDIMVLADVEVSPNPDPERQAVVFMNGLETVSAIAGADQAAELGEALVIAGASCAITPEIATPFPDPASFEVGWTLTPAAGAALSGADTLTPTITATEPGAYTLTLSCRTRCTTIVTDTKTVIAGGIPIPTPTPTPPPLFTQGGCLANLSPTATTPRAMVWALVGLGAGWAWLRSRKRGGATR